MVMWFASYANLVTSCWACTSHARAHGACAIIKMGVSKYSNGLTGMPADLNFGKFTASHFKALITQNANENAYLTALFGEFTLPSESHNFL